MKLYYDNQSMLKLAKNPILHIITKHIEVHHHFIKEMIHNGEIILMYRLNKENISNIFTKPLTQEKLQNFRDGIGVKRNDVNIKGGY